jgi:hypothetical protein
MSAVVTQAIIDYFDARNEAEKYGTVASPCVPVIHMNTNGGEKEENGTGPFIKTRVIENEWNKIDDVRKVVDGVDEHTSFEYGVLVFEIHVQKGLGDKDALAHEIVADKLKKDFVKLELPTSNNRYIHFGEALPKPVITVNKLSGPKSSKVKKWNRLDLFINYYYSEDY